MTTWNGLLEQLATCENAKLAAERTGEQGVQQADAKIAAVTQFLSELTLEHQKDMANCQHQCEQQMSELEAKKAKEVAASTSARLKAEARSEAAHARRIK